MSRQAAAAGSTRPERDLVLAWKRGTNSLRTAAAGGRGCGSGGSGRAGLRGRDAARIGTQGRQREPAASRPRRGLWIVNQLCDLVQLRSFPDGAAVRVHVYLP